MKRKYIDLVAIIGIAGFLFGPSTAFAQISLGTSQTFAVLGGSTVTNTGSSVITGNVGVSPGPILQGPAGFPPGLIVGGTFHANDGVAGQAQSDLTTAYNAVAGTACNVDLTGQDLGGLTLTPGVYCFSSSAFLTGALTLDFQGDPNAVFLFQTGTSLTTASASSVVLINTGTLPPTTCPPNVFWQIGSSATFGTTSAFAGNVLALASITLTTGATLNGRALARNGAVTLDGNNVTLCAPVIVCPIITVNPATLPNGAVGTAYSQTVTGSGGLAPYTFALTSGALPTGLLLNGVTGAITGTPTAVGTFIFTITATDSNGCPGSRAYTIVIAAAGGCPVITLSPTTLPAGTIGLPYSQTISAAGGTAPYTFSVTAGALPAGLTLNAATGAITGTPTTLGLVSFTIQARDALGCLGIRAYSIAIAVVPPAAGPTLDFVGLTILMVLLVGAGLFVMKRFSI